MSKFTADRVRSQARLNYDGTTVGQMLDEFADYLEKKESVAPCPFCGSEDVYGWVNGDGQRGPECMSCGATALNVEKWNRRAGAALSSLSSIEKLIKQRNKLSEVVEQMIQIYIDKDSGQMDIRLVMKDACLILSEIKDGE